MEDKMNKYKYKNEQIQKIIIYNTIQVKLRHQLDHEAPTSKVRGCGFCLKSNNAGLTFTKA